MLIFIAATGKVVPVCPQRPQRLYCPHKRYKLMTDKYCNFILQLRAISLGAFFSSITFNNLNKVVSCLFFFYVRTVWVEWWYFFLKRRTTVVEIIKKK